MKRIFSTVVSCLLFIAFCNGQTGVMKPLADLIDPNDSGWTLIHQWLSTATNKIIVLEKNEARADTALYNIQLSTNSPFGAMIYKCGGMLVDNGWIRILGSGSKQIDRSLPEWNKGKSFHNYGQDSPSYLLIADDALGGLFAINLGGIDEQDIGKVFYFGPNKLKWQTTGLGYADFIVFCFSGDLEKFYKGFRWKGWEDEVTKLNGNQVISCYPLLWTDAALKTKNSRKIIPIQKQWELYQSMNRATAKKVKHKSPAGKKSNS